MNEENMIVETTGSKKQEKQVVSKKRVTDHGEVLTGKREINAMLDLLKQETERIESRFLEPACGNGNFLTEILERKLRVVESRYGKSQLDYERNMVLAVSSIYGIDILEDNVLECRKRLFDIFNQKYTNRFKKKLKDKCRVAIKYILERNIPQPIVFSEWAPVNGSMLKRRDFTFRDLLEHESLKEMPLFSDLGEDVFLPTPLKEYPLVHFMEITDVDEQ